MPNASVAQRLTTRRTRTAFVALATAAIVTAANASQGAYFSQSWGWVALAFLIPTSLMLILERAAVPGRLRAAFALLVVVLAAWIALSAVWSVSSSASVRETERMFVYVGLALALAFVLRRGDAPGVIGGVLVGIALVSGYALATRLFPDRLDTYDDPISSYRLAEPLGYWNALGLLVAMGLLVAIGIVAHSRSLRYSIVAGALLPLLAATLYFTFSRGAWAALVFGFAGAVAIDPRRLRLMWSTLAVAPAAVACIAFASRQSALTVEDAPTDDAVTAGHRFAIAVAALAVCSGLLAWGARRVAGRYAASRGVARAVNVALVVLVVGGALVALVAAGGPSRALSGLKHRFDEPPAAHGSDLNARLFDLSGSFRTEQIAIALDAARERPVIGYGSGSYEYLLYERRKTRLVIRDAHSLYAEMFGEVGAVGLALLTAALLVPLLGAVAARRSRVVAAGAGAYLAWAAASALDWHWEMVGVTTTAFLAGGAALLASDRRRPAPVVGNLRWIALGLAVVLSVLSIVSLVGNQALFAGREALAREEWASAANHARRARALLFWSYEPEIVLGDAAAGLGDREAALAAYKDAVATDPRNWVAWLRLAQVARGAERATAYERVRELNPLEEGLPGDSARAPG